MRNLNVENANLSILGPVFFLPTQLRIIYLLWSGFNYLQTTTKLSLCGALLVVLALMVPLSFITV